MGALVRAKFHVTSKTETPGGCFKIELEPVTGGSPENEAFYKWTPSGQISLDTLNASAAARFEVGKNYYLDFTPAE